MNVRIEANKIYKELSGKIKGEVYADDIMRCIYSVDASILQQMPLCVIFPKDVEDLIQVVNFCNKEGIPLSARGAGTAKTGASLIKDGIIIDFTKHMNKVIEINSGEGWVKVQPGIIYSELNRILKPYGKFFAPDPSSGDYCTIGGMMANNSGGPHSAKYGSTKQHVLDINIILANGEYVNSVTWMKDNRNSLIVSKLKTLLFSNKDYLLKEQPITNCNSSGYNVFESINGEEIDFVKLIVGSEGTLGIFADAKLSIIDLPRAKAIAIAMFNDLDRCGEAITLINELKPAALELIDKKIVNILMNETAVGSRLIPKDTEALLIIEYDSDKDEQAINNLINLKNKLKKIGYYDFYIAKDKLESDTFWKIRKLASPMLKRFNSNCIPLEFIEDTAVHPKILAEYIYFLRNLFKNYKVEAAIFGHASKGNLHVNPEIDITSEHYEHLIDNLMNQVFEFVIANKGTISGEHGNGLIRAHYLSKQYPFSSKIMHEIKRTLDPNGILNPGKIIPSNNDSYLNYIKYKSINREHFLINKNSIIKDNLMNCNECGTCRSYCPVYKATGDERAMPRAKSTLINSILKALLDEQWVYKKELLDVINLCINCKRCLIECPSYVNVPALCIEIKKLFNEKYGEKLRDTILEKESQIMHTAKKFPRLTNFMISNSVIRSCLSYLLDIESSRQIPLVIVNNNYEGYKSDFVSRNKVIYYPGCYSYNHDVEQIKLCVKVLESHNIEVKIPSFICCGVPALSKGAMFSDKVILENTNLLLPYLKDGWKVITSSASCGYALKKEYRQHDISDEYIRYENNILDIHEYLYLLISEGVISLRFKSLPKKVFFHIPCHFLAMGCADKALKLFRMIPDITIKTAEDKCCGMAGTFGLQKENYSLSLRIGEGLFSLIRDEKPDYIITNCEACKLQLEHCLGIKVYHPMQILSFSIAEL